MLKALVSFSLRYRTVVLALACVLLGFGAYTLKTAKLDVFPDFVQPQVEIQTECPGMAPEQVELLVTLPIETTISGLGDMESMRSESIDGLSIITAIFKEGTDIFRARQMLQENLTETAGNLPGFVKTPRMTPLTSSTMDLLKIGLVSTNLSPMDLRTFADWTLKPRLLAVPGVAKCSTFGGEVRQLQVQVLLERLQAYDLSLSDVLAAARVSTGIMGAGFIETRNQRVTLQTEGQALTPELLGEVVIAHTNGASVRLKDVAHVVQGAALKAGDSVIQGVPGVLMTMSSQYGANTLEVTKALEAALAELKPVFEKQGIVLFPALHRPATFIEASIGNMRHSLAMGAVLVAVVLFVLLGSIRTALISLTAIPLSLLTAVVILERFGITLNTITLGGLAIAIGEVVDDSIIDVENIFRRLREHQRAGGSTPAGPSGPEAPTIFSIILNASIEVRSAVVFATFVVALVFLPILTLTGLQGSFFAPLALSYILAIMASLLVALTVTPALSYALFGGGVRKAEEPRLQRWLKTTYSRVLRVASRWPAVIIGAVVILCAAEITGLFFVKPGEFLPEFREGHYVCQIQAAPGTSLPEMVRMGTQLSHEILNNTNVATVSQQAGRAELGEDPWPPSRCELHVELKSLDAEVNEKVNDELRDLFKRFPGIQSEVVTFLGDRLSETIAGEISPIVVNIFGDDLDVLDEKAAEVAKVIGGIKGAVDVKLKSPPGVPRMAIRLRPDRLTQFGFKPVDVLEAIETAYGGSVVAQTHRENQTIDVAVILPPAERQDPEVIGSLMLRNAEGLRLPMRELADIFPTSGRGSISHEGARRRQTITCGASGSAISSVVNEAKRQVAANVSFPAGTYAVFSGAAETAEKAQSQIFLHSGIAAVGILLLLSIVFRNWRNLLLVLANVPFALVGGVIALIISNRLSPGDNPVTIGSLVGFVTLFGITMRNSIMMLTHYEHLITYEGATWGLDTVIRGASERLMPILMTAIVTALGLLPLALAAGQAGREIEGPMALVILGGLVTSTALNLLVLPTLALRFGRFEKSA